MVYGQSKRHRRVSAIDNKVDVQKVEYAKLMSDC